MNAFNFLFGRVKRNVVHYSSPRFTSKRWRRRQRGKGLPAPKMTQGYISVAALEAMLGNIDQ